MDTRNQLDKYAAPDTVGWHFANITNRWAKRGLAAGGFGFHRENYDGQTIFSIAELMGSTEGSAANSVSNSVLKEKRAANDIEKADSAEVAPLNGNESKKVVVQGLNRPLFHFDLQEAVEAAVADARTKTF